jgi:hypothetical protein
VRVCVYGGDTGDMSKNLSATHTCEEERAQEKNEERYTSMLGLEEWRVCGGEWG